jgi:hypothetical protein
MEESMTFDLAVILDNKPGRIADVGELLGNAGLNIEGICGIPSEGKSYLHILVSNTAVARKVLEDAGFTIHEERQVLVLNLDNHPGALGDITRRVAKAGVNIELIYAASKNRIVIGVDKPEDARTVI